MHYGKFKKDKEKEIKADHIISSHRKVAREAERNKETAKQAETMKMTLISPYLPKITLSVNETSQ